MPNQIVPEVVRLLHVHINPRRIWSECTVRDLMCSSTGTTDPLTENLPLTFMNLDYAWTKGCHCHFVKIFSVPLDLSTIYLFILVGIEIPLCIVVTILKCYNLISGVKLSVRSYCFISYQPAN